MRPLRFVRLPYSSPPSRCFGPKLNLCQTPRLPCLRPSFLTLLPQTVLYKAFSTKVPAQQHMPQIPSPIPEEEAEEEVSVELEYAPKNEAETHALREIGYLFVLGDFKKAADLCREYLKTESSAAVRTLLGESYQRTGNLQGAMEEYEKAIKTDPSFGVAPKRLGYMYLEAAEREPPGSEKRADLAEKARVYLEMATKNLPKSADARFGLALARMLQGALDDALEHLDAALKLDPHYLPATQKRGEIYQMRGEWSHAVHEYTHFFNKYPEYYRELGPDAAALDSTQVFSDIVFRRGLCYYHLKDLTLALEDFTAVISVDGPQRDKAYHWRAKCFYSMKDYWKVVEDNTEALKINPEFLQAFNDRAIAYDLLGREDLAEADRRSYNLLKRKLIFEGKI